MATGEASQCNDGDVRQSSLVTMEIAMREEIKELHEKRAAAMMTEIVDLQKERDMAIAKVRKLEKKVKEQEEEMEQRKKRSNVGDGRAELVALLRQSLLEEQLLTADLKRKLQSVKKQNTTLTQQLKNATHDSPVIRRHSDVGIMSPSQPTPLKQSSTFSPHSTSSPSYSPTVVTRRYKLSGVTSSDASTQTSPEPIDQSGVNSDALAMGVLEFEEKKIKFQEELQKHEHLKKNCETLQLECGVLRDSLRDFSCWTRSKLETVEENMDIFRVIYSLHSSLSQEQSVLKELQDKLKSAELKILKLVRENKQLAVAASEAEEKYQTEMRKLQEKLTVSKPPLPPTALLTPPPPLSSRTMTKGRKFSSPQLIHRPAS